MKSSVHDVESVESALGKRRYFTVAAANRALVLVRRIVSDVIVEYARLVDLQEMLDAAEKASALAEADSARQELVLTVDRLQSCLEELDQVGVELKDWSLGLVDFPCRLGRREVYLCWRYGESCIGHWHESDEGFAGRRPIETLSMEQPATPVDGLVR